MSSHELQFPSTAASSHYPLPTGRIAIVGAGKVGLSIALKLHPLDQIEWVLVRSEKRLQELRFALPDVQLISSLKDAAIIPDCVILAVSDSAIEPLAQALALEFGPALEGTLVMHCSGFLGRDILSSCAKHGARTVAAHPFQTFTHAHERLLNGISWGIDCEADDESRVGHLIRSLGGTPMVLSPFARAHKALYHISAVFASNYVEALLSTTRDMAEIAQIPPTVFLQPIVGSAVEASMLSMAHGGRPPLSGPIARGDVSAVRLHLEALSPYPSMFRQYCYFALATNEFALQHGYIEEEQYLEIKEELDAALSPRIG